MIWSHFNCISPKTLDKNKDSELIPFSLLICEDIWDRLSGSQKLEI
jgi:hypothetical protein